MGIRVEIDARARINGVMRNSISLEPESLTISEDSTPVQGGDSSGGVGSLSFTVPHIQDSQILRGKEVRIYDSRRGYTVGRIDTISASEDNRLDTYTCYSRLVSLNTYNNLAQPFTGRLEDAFRYYASLADVKIGILVSGDIAGMRVTFPSWEGELWYNMKEMGIAIGVEVSLVAGVIVLRKIRERELVSDRDTQRQFEMSGDQLAQSIEIYNYNNVWKQDTIVYPPNGWDPETEIINVNAGESIIQQLELSASVISIKQPEFRSSVATDYKDASVYTVSMDDGKMLSQAQWKNNGGSLRVEINPDTTSLSVHITAPSAMRNSTGELNTVFSISMGTQANGDIYSTLRIIGTGTHFFKEIVAVPTGLPSSMTGTDVGVTIDNPFVSNLNDAYHVGMRAAQEYKGYALGLTGDVTAINRREDTGEAATPPYAYVKSLFAGMSYAQVKADPRIAGKTYGQVKEWLFSLVSSDMDNQSYGNLNGARVWHRMSRRWYRVRSGTHNTPLSSYDAEDDLTIGDADSHYAGKTYAQLKEIFAGYSYREAFLLGLFDGYSYETEQDPDIDLMISNAVDIALDGGVLSSGGLVFVGEPIPFDVPGSINDDVYFREGDTIGEAYKKGDG